MTSTNVVPLPTIETIEDGFRELATSSTTMLIRGDAIKFRKGEYPVGRDEGAMSGATLAAYEATQAWQKWQDRKLVDQIVIGEAEVFPAKVEDIENNDNPGEWTLSYILYLRDLETGHDYTFLTSSNGGRRAVVSLSAAIMNKRRTNPGAVPLIRLDTGSFRTASYGMVQCPQFTIVGWVDPGGRPLAAAPLSVELSDEIPF